MNDDRQDPTTKAPSGTVITMAPPWQLALDANFGSVERWRDEFGALAEELVDRVDGSGGVVLAFQPRQGTLVNQWVADCVDIPDGGVTLLAVTTDELVGHDKEGGNAGARVDAFVARVDWAAVYERYQAAVHAASDPYGASQDELEGALLLDVRRAGVYRQAGSVIEGARWFDPAMVAQWAQKLPSDRPIVVYCIYGHEVGRSTALRLRATGLNARFLDGGMDAWQSAGRPIADRPAG